MAAQRNRVLESENKLLLTETDKLREVRPLVLNLELGVRNEIFSRI